jgi:hypothetical protein
MAVQAAVVLGAVRVVRETPHLLHHHKGIMREHPQSLEVLAVVAQAQLAAMVLQLLVGRVVLVQHQALAVHLLLTLVAVVVVFTQLEHQAQVALEAGVRVEQLMVIMELRELLI